MDHVDHSQTVLTGLEDPNGDPEDRSVYHGKTVWYTNNRIYTLYGLYLRSYSRILCCDPDGNLLYQFTDMENTNSFSILGDYVYVWAKDGDIVEDGSTSVGRIIKLTLDLEFVCHITTRGGRYSSLNKYLEWPGQHTNDDYQYLFSWHKWPGEPGYVSKYQVDPTIELIEGGHDPRWAFEKSRDV